MAKVFIGVGHGGSDPGAIGNGFEEADLNLAIALACHSELVRHGVTVQMSRTKDENDTLTEEIRECNIFNPDLAIDIHNNAGGGDGVEAYYYTGGGTSKVLAQNVVNAIVEIGQNSRGVKPNIINGVKEYFGFIRETYAPAIIVECAFIDNATDIKIIDTAAEQKAMGVAIAKGILKTLGIAYKAASTPSVTGAVAGYITGVDVGRGTNALVLYKRGVNNNGKTDTNQWGTEVALDKDFKVISKPVYGVGNMSIPAGGYVLSGHGVNSTWLLNKAKVGVKLTLKVGV